MLITTQTTDTQLRNGVKGIEIDSIAVVVNFQEPNNYFGGQVVLTADDDNISFNSTTEELQDLAIKKAKQLIAESKLAEPVQVEPDDYYAVESSNEETTADDSTNSTDEEKNDESEEGTGDEDAETPDKE